MNKHHLHHLLTRYRSGDCTEQEKRLVEQWFALIDGEEPNHSHRENQLIEERIWAAIQGNQRSVPSLREKVRPLLFNWRWVAAAVFIITIWGGYQLNQSRRSGKDLIAGMFPKGMVSKTNDTAKPVLLTLDDGTKVSLAPHSSIEYPAQFRSGKREVYLKGKAFFDVTRDPEHPFFVYTGAVATRVLGTSFWVDVTDDSSAVEVSVVTGRVSVSERAGAVSGAEADTKNGVILLPNQRVLYTSVNQSFVTSLVLEPVMLGAYAGAFVFSDTPLSEVADLLEKAYGIEIELDNDRLKNCLLTADINKQPLFTKLDLISSSVNARYKVVGTRIVLSGKGCSNN
jgi:transmembrane sensor